MRVIATNLISFVTDDEPVKGKPNESIIDQLLNKLIVKVFDLEHGFL